MKHINVQIIAALVIIGSLIRRENVDIGHWVTIGAIVLYVIVNFILTLKMAREYNSLRTAQRAKLFVYLIFVYIVISGAITMSVNYFAILVLLAVDYLLTDKHKQN